jgi:hypothetical protein
MKRVRRLSGAEQGASHRRTGRQRIAPQAVVSSASMPPPMLIAQAVVEKGMLDSLGARVQGMRYEIDARIGQGGTKFLLIGLGVVLVLWLIRRN